MIKLIATVATALSLLQCTGSGYSIDMDSDEQISRIDSMIQTTKNSITVNPDSARIAFEQLLLTTKNKLTKKQEGTIYLQMGIICSMKMELEKSDSLHQKAALIFNTIGELCLLASAYTNLGINQSKRGNYASSIDLYKKVEKTIENQHDRCGNLQEGNYNNTGLAYMNIGKMDSARFYYEKCLEAARKNNNKNMMANALINIGNLLQLFNEYKKGTDYFLEAIGLYEEVNNKTGLLGAFVNIASTYVNINNYESALLFFQKADSLSTALNLPNRKASIYHNMGLLYFEQENYDKSLEYVKKSLAIKLQFSDSVGIASSQNALSAIFNKNGNHISAKENATKALDYALRTNNTNLLLLAYNNLYTAQFYLGEFEKALELLSKRDELRDSIFSKQKIEAVQEWQVKYETAQKEAEIQLLREHQMAQQKITSLYIGIIILLIIVVILGILWIGNHQKKTFLLLEQMKYRTIKSKFIPHFTGNVLNSINYLISKNPIAAKRYIADFSLFTNQSLLNADKFCCTLKEEIAYAENYLKLEKLRLEDNLDYAIHLSSEIDIQMEIPTMILQTFCENALKHGIRPKNSRGSIKISAYNHNGFDVVTVEDDGVGREKAKLLRTEGNREGLKIVEQQIKLFNKKNKTTTYLEIVDLYTADNIPAGARFELHIPSAGVTK